MRRRRMRKRGMRCLSLFLGIAMLMSGCARAEDPVQNAENRGATPAPGGGRARQPDHAHFGDPGVGGGAFCRPV